MKNTRVKSSGGTNLTQTPGKFLKMLTQEEEKPWITREDPQACEICASNFVSVCLSTADFFFFYWYLMI